MPEPITPAPRTAALPISVAMGQPPDSSSTLVVNLRKKRPCGELVNEHSFILNHSPQDGKKFREAFIWLAEHPFRMRQDAFRCWIVTGRKRLREERTPVPSCGISERVES
jgi:hypothetical protein